MKMHWKSWSQKGVSIYPKPAALRIIKNKILQKEFYKKHSIPSSEFIVTKTMEELVGNKAYLPAVHKLANGGYDGRGVQVMRTASEISKGFNAPAVLEKMVNIKKEIAVIIAVNDKNETAIYPPVEMAVDPNLNLLIHQLSPAELPERVFWKVEAIALKL
jgi:5-(carboxyamino)imidazole ribonucleotide synthase